LIPEAMPPRYRRHTIVPTAPAPASTAATREVHARVDRTGELDDRRRFPLALLFPLGLLFPFLLLLPFGLVLPFGTLICLAVLRKVADIQGATCLTTTVETAGAMVDVV
jgi:hypothetical protein